MLKRVIAIIALLFIVANPAIAKDGDSNVLILETTTGIQSSGLLDEILPEFQKDTGVEVKVIAAEPNDVYQDGREGKADILLVYDKVLEAEFVEDGFGLAGQPIMHTDFILIGPRNDPAGVKGLADVGAALAKIAEQKSTFVSRGDNSNTHLREQRLWQKSGVQLADEHFEYIKKGKMHKVDFVAPVNSNIWYRAIGADMDETLLSAEEKQSYTISDRNTYVRHLYGRTPPIDLVIFAEGGEDLLKAYSLIPLNKEKFPAAKPQLGQQLIQWMISKKGQGLIGNFTTDGGIRLFEPDIYPHQQ